MLRLKEPKSLVNILLRPLCQGCNRPLRARSHDFCFGCRRTLLAPVEGNCLFAHQGAGKALVKGMRGEFQFRSGKLVLDLLARQGWLSRWEGIEVIALAPRAKPRREDGLPILADALAQKLGAKHLPLLKKENRRSQHGQDRGTRMNCPPFIVLRPGAELIAGKNVLVIDDVDTTGTTLELCAYRLREAGAAQVLQFSVARQMMESFKGEGKEPEDEGEEMQPFLLHLFV